MKISLFAFLAALSLSSAARADEASFLAHADIQAQAPNAFALQPEAHESLVWIAQSAGWDRAALVSAIQSDTQLAALVRVYPTLDSDAQELVLRQVFALEVETLGITAPELVIAPGSTAGPAYFDFDVSAPGPGRVLLNPDKFAELGPYESLLLLIHETRHASQFQEAFAPDGDDGYDQGAPSPRAAGYRAAFTAQKALQGQLGFCDFLTLLNEYEAFQYANGVMGSLTAWTIDTLSLGTYASQFDANGTPRLDLLALLDQATPAKSALERFNEIEHDQYVRLTSGN